MFDTLAPVFAVAVALLIATLSLLSKDARLMTLVTPRMHRAGHFASYVILAFLCALLLTTASPLLRSVAGFLVATAFGVLMEFLQRYRPGRSPSRKDALVNAAGAALGATAALAWSVYVA